MDRKASGSILTRRVLVEQLWTFGSTESSIVIDNLAAFIKTRINLGNLEEPEEVDLRKVLRRFYSLYKIKWSEAHRMRDRFLKKNQLWLNEELSLPYCEQHSKSLPGRRQRDFAESSYRSKLRKTKELREQLSTEELTFATTSALRTSGKRTAGNIVKEATATSPKRASRIWKTYCKSKSQSNVKFTEDEALSLFVECKFTKEQYLVLRDAMNRKGLKVLPSYEAIRKAKRRCYPDPEHTTVSEVGASIKLQSLLDHTTKRLLQAQTHVLDTVKESDLQDFKLISKWGCDGSSGQSVYKQRFSDTSFIDSDLFLTSFVPLRITTSSSGTTIWQNPRPSSVRYCRPISFHFKKETSDFVRQQVSGVQKEINELLPTQININNKIVKVRHDMNFTMIDGKLCNTITSTNSAQVCYVCGAVPKEMNNIEKVKCKSVKTETFKYGLSPLHSYIRFFECLLHISYRLDIKKWQIRGDTEKAAVKIRKQKIQEEFREKMGLLIDVPKSGGSGTTNDGNTARRFFEDPALSAEITGVDVELIKNFSTILKALSSHFEINPAAFDTFAFETATLFVNKYPWYYMPISVHKVLIHGYDIISAALISIGQLSESAQEARFKDIKFYRQRNTRKCSREANNEDLLHGLLLSSDPVITSMRRHSGTPKVEFSEDVRKLLKIPEEQVEDISEIETDDSSS